MNSRCASSHGRSRSTSSVGVAEAVASAVGTQARTPEPTWEERGVRGRAEARHQPFGCRLPASRSSIAVHEVHHEGGVTTGIPCVVQCCQQMLLQPSRLPVVRTARSQRRLQHLQEPSSGDAETHQQLAGVGTAERRPMNGEYDYRPRMRIEIAVSLEKSALLQRGPDPCLAVAPRDTRFTAAHGLVRRNRRTSPIRCAGDQHRRRKPETCRLADAAAGNAHAPADPRATAPLPPARCRPMDPRRVRRSRPSTEPAHHPHRHVPPPATTRSNPHPTTAPVPEHPTHTRNIPPSAARTTCHISRNAESSRPLPRPSYRYETCAEAWVQTSNPPQRDR